MEKENVKKKSKKDKKETAKKVAVGAGVFAAGAVTAVGVSRVLYGKPIGKVVGNRYFGKNIGRFFEQFSNRGGTIDMLVENPAENVQALKNYSAAPVMLVDVEETLNKILENKNDIYGIITLKHN